MQANFPALSIEGLSLSLGRERSLVRNLSLSLYPNETLALVGESGSGKTLTAMAILGLFVSPKIQVTSGAIFFEGKNLLGMTDRERAAIRSTSIGFIPQNPMNALNPTLSVGFQLTESFRGARHKAREKALSLLERVGIADPARHFHSYPHELSGGMQQRVMIAMSLMNDPKILIADEPTTALDVTIQAQIIDLLKALGERFRMSLLFITHDLGVVAQIADRVAVMYGGQIVETAPVGALFRTPCHPYSELLLRASKYKTASSNDELLYSMLRPADTLCPFFLRCQHAMNVCGKKQPPDTAVESSHVFCWRYVEDALRTRIP
jgi:oligopeptide/dipeptide ABC transporter ATP-binding protein